MNLGVESASAGDADSGTSSRRRRREVALSYSLIILRFFKDFYLTRTLRLTYAHPTLTTQFTNEVGKNGPNFNEKIGSASSQVRQGEKHSARWLLI